jgi:DHA2 family multidrug resistance protein
MMQYKGFEGVTAQKGGLAVIYEQFIRQASMMSFNDAFYLTSLILICIVPLLLLMKRGKTAPSAEMH